MRGEANKAILVEGPRLKMNDNEKVDMGVDASQERRLTTTGRVLRKIDVAPSENETLSLGPKDLTEYTQEEIDYLISCPKRISDPPKKELSGSRGHLRNALRLVSSDGQYEFSVFMRVNEDFQENFSIGLTYLPREGKGDVLLYRCNGPHGPHENFDHHATSHVHVFNPDDVEAGLRPGKTATITDEYVTYQDALAYFARKCNISDAGQYLGPSQMPLFPPKRPES